MINSFSIIIPLYNDSEVLKEHLPALQQRCLAQEIIIVDGGSTDGGPEWVEQQAALRLIRSPIAQRAHQMNLGARAASGEYLLFLHADTALSEVAIDELKGALLHQEIDAAAFRFALDASGFSFRVMEWGVWMRCKLFSLPYGDQGLFIRRAFFDELGGFPSMPMMEDVAIVDAISQKTRLHLFSGRAITSARRWKKHGAWRMMFINWGMILAYRFGVAPEKLSAWRNRV